MANRCKKILKCFSFKGKPLEASKLRGKIKPLWDKEALRPGESLLRYRSSTPALSCSLHHCGDSCPVPQNAPKPGGHPPTAVETHGGSEEEGGGPSLCVLSECNSASKLYKRAAVFKFL